MPSRGSGAVHLLLVSGLRMGSCAGRSMLRKRASHDVFVKASLRSGQSGKVLSGFRSRSVAVSDDGLVQWSAEQGTLNGACLCSSVLCFSCVDVELYILDNLAHT